MMEWYSTTFGLVGALGTVIGLLSKWAGYRARQAEERCLHAWRTWILSPEGLLFAKGLIDQVKGKSHHAQSGE